MRNASLASMLVLVTIGAATEVKAAGRLVSTRGNDATNDCLSSTSPCRTIVHAMSQGASGDVIEVAKGTYDERIVVLASIDLALRGGWKLDFTTRDPAKNRTKIKDCSLFSAGAGYIDPLELRRLHAYAQRGLQARSPTPK